LRPWALDSEWPFADGRAWCGLSTGVDAMVIVSFSHRLSRTDAQTYARDSRAWLSGH
jgi:hypothetical protein